MDASPVEAISSAVISISQLIKKVIRLQADPSGDALTHAILVIWYVGVALAIAIAIIVLNLDRVRSFIS